MLPKDQFLKKVAINLSNKSLIRELISSAYDEVREITSGVIYADPKNGNLFPGFIINNEVNNSGYIQIWGISLEQLYAIPPEIIFTDTELKQIVNKYNYNIPKFVKDKNIDIKQRHIDFLEKIFIQSKNYILKQLNLFYPVNKKLYSPMEYN